MLPVSGALQLQASDAIGERPSSSASGAYSRLVSPAPCSDCGRNMFQNPAARAFFLSSCMTGGLSHGKRLRVSASCAA